MPNTGSTMPDAAPHKKAVPLCTPPLRRGNDTAAPSGKFCNAMPTASAIAAGSAPAPPASAAPANASPTAMPSGMLCSVTANTSMVVLRQCDGRPSGVSLPMCRCGRMRSNTNKKSAPIAKPPATGQMTFLPSASNCSMAGKSNEKTAAAVMTPAANPKKICCVFCDMSFRKKNTVAAPSTVARQVAPVPISAKISSRPSIHPSFFAVARLYFYVTDVRLLCTDLTAANKRRFKAAFKRMCRILKRTRRRGRIFKNQTRRISRRNYLPQ